MSNWISIIFQYALQANDPSWACELTHRDAGVAGTYYFYCAQTLPDGIEIISVGKFVSDAKSAAKPAP